ncbi:DUF2752 domain-containing protein [Mycolicibacterium sphagni]|uniref:DUF2752 domain-containing protein n=1 Tax=Mycolicibacterium sphagni TaxID=1786 RepID=A0A255DMV1_9MYCO|nr:DUF2752 domain-containing protein [Mycolicibacterium sphagni]MCV7179844.1 DUF2752 domain-containing protein [Mycolicibacterium sphagni]OYN80676.1 hypothetical protein CG716_07385 [Mycolicibacterium sphagni]
MERSATAIGTGAAAIGALTYVGVVDPHRPGTMFPPCPFRLLTGWNCPACGGLRMTHDLLHGDMGAAVVDNVFLLVGLPLLAIWLVWRISRGERLFPGPAIVTIVVAAISWTVVRNVPGFPLVPTLISR